MTSEFKNCPVCRSNVSRDNLPGRDLLWEAIPLHELLDIAKARVGDCSTKSEAEIRRCAEEVVRSQICECCRDEKTVVATIVDEFVRELRHRPQ